MMWLVGYSADQGGREALALGILLARASKGSLVVCTIVPQTWGHPSMARVDAEYAKFLEQHANRTLDKARAQVGKLAAAQYIWSSAPSVRQGLFETAQDIGADCMVLGAARGGVLQGGVTAGVLHSAPLPVALAPRGYAPSSRARLSRITCAVSATPESLHTATRAHALCAALQVPLRLLTFVVRDKQMYPTGAGYRAEDMVANQLRRQATDGQKALIAALPPKPPTTAAIADGKTWKAAFGSVPWKEGEILAVGSSNLGSLLRVFLGSNAAKILHHAPVPRFVLPWQGSTKAI